MSKIIKRNGRALGVSFLVFMLIGLPCDFGRLYKINDVDAASNEIVIEKPTVWDLNSAPIIINNTDYIFKSDLTIKKGVSLYLKNNSKITVKGDLKIEGEKDHPVRFEGADENDINFSVFADGRNVEIANAIFEKGGGHQCTSMNEKSLFSIAQAENCTPLAALNISSLKTRIVDSIFERNFRGINFLDNGDDAVFNNKFIHNKDLAIYSKAVVEINAASNCWMRPSGPQHEDNPTGKGEKIEGDINFVNWQECGSDFKPVIIIPGIGGSWSWTTMFNDEFSDNWNISPGASDYQSLVQSFRDREYIENRDFFIVLYDWRKDNHESMELFLKPMLEKVERISFDKKYDIVAHSMGGFVALDYIYDENYGNDIGKVVLEGTPLMGSSKVYPIWEGGYIPEDWSIMDKYFTLYKFFSPSNWDMDNYDLIHENFPSVAQLLPFYDFIKKNESEEIISFYDMHEQNTFIPYLFEKMMNNQDQFSFGNITLIEGTGLNTSKIVKVDNYEGENSEKLWKDGIPNPYPLEYDISEGDGTVPNIADGMFPIKIIKIQDASHGHLPTLALNEMSDILGIERPKKEYHLASSEELYIALACPVDVKVVAPDGSFISKDENTIEGAVYDSDGKEDGRKLIFISDPQQGDYAVEISGNGNGHFEMLAVRTGKNGKSSKEIGGEIAENQIIGYELMIDEEDAVDIQPAEGIDDEAPTIEIKSPGQDKEYASNEVVGIEFEISDNASESDKIEAEVFLDGEVYEKNEIDLAFQDPGGHSLKVAAMDEAENKAEKEVAFFNVPTFQSLIKNVGHYYDLKLIKNKGQERSLQLRLLHLDSMSQYIEWLAKHNKGKFGKNNQLQKLLEKAMEKEIDQLVNRIEKMPKKHIDPIAADFLIKNLEYIKSNL